MCGCGGVCGLSISLAYLGLRSLTLLFFFSLSHFLSLSVSRYRHHRQPRRRPPMLAISQDPPVTREGTPRIPFLSASRREKKDARRPRTCPGSQARHKEPVYVRLDWPRGTGAGHKAHRVMAHSSPLLPSCGHSLAVPLPELEGGEGRCPSSNQGSPKGVTGQPRTRARTGAAAAKSSRGMTGRFPRRHSTSSTPLGPPNSLPLPNI